MARAEASNRRQRSVATSFGSLLRAVVRILPLLLTPAPLSLLGVARSFNPPLLMSRPPFRRIRTLSMAGSRSFAASTAPSSSLVSLLASAAPFDGDLIESARAKLSWEVIAEREGRPALDLSRKASAGGGALALSEETAAASGDDEEANNATTDAAGLWESGEVWDATRTRLVDLWVLPRDYSGGRDADLAAATSRGEDNILWCAPQLLRLPTDVVVSTTRAVLDARLPPALLREEPVLLTYPASHIEGGLEFLGTMMMLPREAVVTACRDVPGFLVGGVEGWMQEQAVKRALGEAGEATDGANRRIAGEAAQSLRAMGRMPPGAGLL